MPILELAGQEGVANSWRPLRASIWAIVASGHLPTPASFATTPGGVPAAGQGPPAGPGEIWKVEVVVSGSSEAAQEVKTASV